MSSQKLTKADRLYLRELQNHLTNLRHEKDGFLTNLRNLLLDTEHIRKSQKLIKQRLRIIDLRISESQKDIKALEAKSKS